MRLPRKLDRYLKLSRRALRLGGEEVSRGGDGAEGLPHELTQLLDRSERLYERVRHLDRRMYVEGETEEAPHPVLSQQDRLKNAFGG